MALEKENEASLFSRRQQEVLGCWSGCQFPYKGLAGQWGRLRKGRKDFCFDIFLILEQKAGPVGDWILVPRLLHEKDTHTSQEQASERVICLGGDLLSTCSGKGIN